MGVVLLGLLLFRLAAGQCNVLSEIPSHFTTYDDQQPLIYLEFVDDCYYPVIVSYTNDGLSAWWSGGANGWVGQQSTSRLQVYCDVPDTYQMTFNTSNGEEAITQVSCLGLTAAMDSGLGRGAVVISSNPGQEERTQWSVTALDDVSEGHNVSLSYHQYQKSVLRNTTYTAVEATCDGLGSEMFWGGWRDVIHDWKCDLLDHLPDLSNKKHCRGPTTTTTASTGKEVCCQSLTDIRGNSDYEMYEIGEDLYVPVQIPFLFLLANGGRIPVVLVYPEAAIAWFNYSPRHYPPQPLPVVESAGFRQLSVGYWQNYTGYAEIGGLAVDDEYIIQWTDLEVEGGERFTQQITLKATGEWSIRTNLCENQTGLFTNAVTGYQTWQSENEEINYEQYNPYFAGWDLTPNLQTDFEDTTSLLRNITFDPTSVLLGAMDEPIDFDVVTYGSAEEFPNWPAGEVRGVLANGIIVSAKEVQLTRP